MERERKQLYENWKRRKKSTSANIKEEANVKGDVDILNTPTVTDSDSDGRRSDDGSSDGESDGAIERDYHNRDSNLSKGDLTPLCQSTAVDPPTDKDTNLSGGSRDLRNQSDPDLPGLCQDPESQTVRSSQSQDNQSSVTKRKLSFMSSDSVAHTARKRHRSGSSVSSMQSVRSTNSQTLFPSTPSKLKRQILSYGSPRSPQTRSVSPSTSHCTPFPAPRARHKVVMKKNYMGF